MLLDPASYQEYPQLTQKRYLYIIWQQSFIAAYKILAGLHWLKFFVLNIDVHLNTTLRIPIMTSLS